MDEMRDVLKRWKLDLSAVPAAGVSRPDATRTGALARAVAAGGRLVGRAGGRGAGAEPAHDRRVAGELSAGWSLGANHVAAGEPEKVHEVGTSEHVWGWVRAEVT